MCQNNYFFFVFNKQIYLITNILVRVQQCSILIPQLKPYYPQSYFMYYRINQFRSSIDSIENDTTFCLLSITLKKQGMTLKTPKVHTSTVVLCSTFRASSIMHTVFTRYRFKSLSRHVSPRSESLPQNFYIWHSMSQSHPLTHPVLQYSTWVHLNCGWNHDKYEIIIKLINYSTRVVYSNTFILYRSEITQSTLTFDTLIDFHIYVCFYYIASKSRQHTLHKSAHWKNFRKNLA